MLLPSGSKNLQKVWPKIDPCGTPYLSISCLNNKLSVLTKAIVYYCFLL